MIKLIIKILLGIGFLVFLLTFFVSYKNSWYRYFPEYKLGTCLRDPQISRVYKVIHYKTHQKGNTWSEEVKILEVGDQFPGSFEVGQIVYLPKADNYEVVDCPKK